MIKEIVYYFFNCKATKYATLFITACIRENKSRDDNIISLLDTSVGSQNIGDSIIMDYCKMQAADIFGNIEWNTVSTHVQPEKNKLDVMKKSKIKLLCGTNILQGDMFRPALLWLPRIYPEYKGLILFGTGWNSYSTRSNVYTRLFYKFILSKKYTHAVRDNFTKQKLEEMGIRNVVCTACPTMWRLTPEFCEGIRQEKGKYVVTTLTDYDQDTSLDTKMFEILCESYERVYLWPQGTGDKKYFDSLSFVGKENIIMIGDNLYDYDSFLEINAADLDYVGTRLHGGIRALNHSVRTIIVAVDNRAIEIGKSTNLLVVPRNEINHRLKKTLQSSQRMDIKIPLEEIEKWKGQFSNEYKKENRICD